MGREERFRTDISGMEPRRIAVVMLLPHEPHRQGILTYCNVHHMSTSLGEALGFVGDNDRMGCLRSLPRSG